MAQAIWLERKGKVLVMHIHVASSFVFAGVVHVSWSLVCGCGLCGIRSCVSCPWSLVFRICFDHVHGAWFVCQDRDQERTLLDSRLYRPGAAPTSGRQLVLITIILHSVHGILLNLLKF